MSKRTRVVEHSHVKSTHIFKLECGHTEIRQAAPGWIGSTNLLCHTCNAPGETVLWKFTVRRHTIELFSVEINSRVRPTDQEVIAQAENPHAVQVLRERVYLEGKK
jgi:hypothetical protein